MNKERTIIHLDMDAFFASVEQRDRPELRGLPLIIGGLESRGVVSTCSYEARRYGVHSAMPTAQAKRLCPDGVFLWPDHRKYAAVSREIFRIFERYTPLIEGLSLDEAFLDVTGSQKLFGDGVTIARRIKREIQEEMSLTASVGISYNKFLAKLASDLEKPNGLVVVRPEDLVARVHPLPLSRIWGVGKKSAEQLQRLGLRTIGDVAQMDVERMRAFLGSFAEHIHRLANGLDDRPVETNRERKSIGQEHTFNEDVRDRETLETTLLAQAEKVARRQTLAQPTNLEKTLYDVAKQLLAKCSLGPGDAIRLIGMSVSGLTAEGQQAEAEVEQAEQLSLFDDPAPAAPPPVPERDPRQQELSRAIDALKDKFGESVLTRARLVKRDKEEQ